METDPTHAMKQIVLKRLVQNFIAIFTPFLVCLVLLWPMVLYYCMKYANFRSMDTIIKQNYDYGKYSHANESRTIFNSSPILQINGKLTRNMSVYLESKIRYKSNIMKQKSNSVTNISHKSVIYPTTVYKYYLTASIMVRIYKEDKHKWTIKELKQWMHYLFFAGVEHIYLCNHYESTEERLRPLLTKYIDKGLLTYIDWPWNASNNKGKIIEHQVNCYYRVITKYGNDSKWQLSIDMDEYPLCKNDFSERFLSRYLNRKEKEFKNDFKAISQIVMENYLMMGQGDRSKTMIIERITRITRKRYNKLSKPIFRPRNVLKCWVHWWDIRKGDTIYANASELRMLHYWGSRTQNWGPDTEETIQLTNVFQDVAQHIAPSVKTSLLSFGEMDAFSNETGP